MSCPGMAFHLAQRTETVGADDCFAGFLFRRLFGETGEAPLHLAPAADRGVVRIDDDVAPQEAGALGDRARQLHALGESERQAAGGERGGRGAELAPAGIAALAVERARKSVV